MLAQEMGAVDLPDEAAQPAKLSTCSDARAIIASIDPRVGTGRDVMFPRLKAAGATEQPPEPAIEYKGYRIRAAPYRNSGQYQTAGIIEKDAPDGVKSHRFVRADMHHSRDDAIAFTISKAKQIIDLQGDRIFA